MKTNQAEHILIFNSVKNTFNNAVPDMSEHLKNVLATRIAVELKEKVRVKERDE